MFYDTKAKNIPSSQIIALLILWIFSIHFNRLLNKNCSLFELSDIPTVNSNCYDVQQRSGIYVYRNV